MTNASIDPSTTTLIESFEALPPSTPDEFVTSAHGASERWRRADIRHRSELLTVMAGLLRDSRTRLARLMALEMGKPLEQGQAEIEECAWVCEYYAEHGPDLLASCPVESEARRSEISYQPLGVVLAVMPWNFPFWQAAHSKRRLSRA